MRKHATELTDENRINALKKACEAYGNSQVLSRRIRACRSRQLRVSWTAFSILNLFLIVIFCLRNRPDLLSLILPYGGVAYVILLAICGRLLIRDRSTSGRLYGHKLDHDRLHREWDFMAFEDDYPYDETEHQRLCLKMAKMPDLAVSEKFSSEERRWVVRFGLKYYHLPCSVCKQWPGDLGPTDCDACGKP